MSDTNALDAALEAHRDQNRAYEDLVRGIEAAWSDGSRKTDYERYFDIRQSAPSSVNADLWVAENFPSAWDRYHKIETASAEYSTQRQKLLDALFASLQATLSALGAHFGQQVVSALQQSPTPIISEIVEREYENATAFRRDRVDGLPVRYASDGMFSQAFHREIGRHFGLKCTGRNWIQQIRTAIHQPAYATIEALGSDLDDLGTPWDTGFTYVAERDGRILLDAQFDMTSPNATLELIRANPDKYLMTGPYVVDPELRTVAADALDAKIRAYDAADMSEDYVAGRIIALRRKERTSSKPLEVRKLIARDVANLEFRESELGFRIGVLDAPSPSPAP